MRNKTIVGRAALAALTGPLLLMLATGLTGCAQTGSTNEAQASGAGGKSTFARVLIVGVTPDVNQRCAFEYFMVSRLQSEKTEAIRSCDSVKDKYAPLTRESIDQAVAATQVDAVIATILVAREAGAKTGSDRDTRGGAYYKATGSGYATSYWGMYGVPVVYGEFQTAPPITTVKGQVKVETRVYETHGPTLVYTVTTTAKKIESTDEGLAAVTTQVADRLHREGLVR